MDTTVIVYAIPFFLLMIGAEMYVARRQKKQLYEINDTIGNLFSGISEQAISIFAKSVLLVVADYVRRHYALFDIPFNWWSVLLLLVLFDFIYYWAHRLGHEINFLWGAHIVHHHSPHFNLSVALRQPWFLNNLVFILFLPIPLLGFNILAFALVSAFSTLYQFWIHTQTIDRLPAWFEWLFNTPSHHRVHHGRNPQYLDKNYGAVFIVWDRLFGTFEPEHETVDYGITIPFASKNAVWANVYYWKMLLHDLRNIPSLRQKWRYITAAPARLSHIYQQKMAVVSESQREAAQLKPVSASLSKYVLVHCSLIIAALCCLLYYEHSLSNASKLLTAAAIVYGTLTAGALLDGKWWAKAAEYIRLILLFPIVVLLFYHQPWLLLYCLIASLCLVVLSFIYFAKTNPYQTANLVVK